MWWYKKYNHMHLAHIIHLIFFSDTIFHIFMQGHLWMQFTIPQFQWCLSQVDMRTSCTVLFSNSPVLIRFHNGLCHPHQLRQIVSTSFIRIETFQVKAQCNHTTEFWEHTELCDHTLNYVWNYTELCAHERSFLCHSGIPTLVYCSTLYINMNMIQSPHLIKLV